MKNKKLQEDIPVNANPEIPTHKYQVQIDNLKRDQYGFLPNIEYHFKDDNCIDWRKMIPQKYLVPNKQKFPKDTDLSKLNVAELENHQLLILMAGARFALALQGGQITRKYIAAAHEGYVAMTCEVTLMPSYENNYEYKTYIGESCAHFGNTDSFGRNYLCEIAGNRSEVRAIKTALGIEILGKDEIEGSQVQEEAPSSYGNKPINTLINFLSSNKITFDKFKAARIEVGDEEAKNWKSFDDIKEGNQILGYIGWAKKRLEEKANNK